MQDYILFTDKGPALLREESAASGRVILAGIEYSFPMEKCKKKSIEGTSESRKVDHVESLVHAAMQVLQSQKCGKSGGKRGKSVEVVLLDKKTESKHVTKKHQKAKVRDIILGGLAELFQFKFFGDSKKPKNLFFFPEGEFSCDKAAIRKYKGIEADKVFEVEDQEEVFECKYQIVLGEEQEEKEKEKEKEKEAQIEGGVKEKSTEAVQAGTAEALKKLKAFEANFFAGELGFVLGLAKSKGCIVEIGQWIYNNSYIAIFGNMIQVIEIITGIFVNTVARSIPKDILGMDIEAEIGPKEVLEHTRLLYLPEEKKQKISQVLVLLQECIGQNRISEVISQVSLSFVEYCEELSKMAYSPHFIKYISIVEENIKLYKTQTKSEIAAAERKFRCNICFLFVDIYHRVVKYKMYTEESQKLLSKNTDLAHPQIRNSLALLQKYNNKLSVLLKATERYKNMKELKNLQVEMPDCTDEFVDMLELTNGYVVVTKETLVLINEKYVIGTVHKKEVWGCYTDSKDFSTSYIDLAVSSLFPPAPDFVVDCIDNIRIHWIRLHFKWEGCQEKFISIFNSSSIPNIPELNLSLVDSPVVIKKRLTGRPFKNDILRSHLRMLTIREQRKHLPTSDLYIYGTKEKLTEQLVFKIKAWVDSSLEEYAKNVHALSAPARSADLYAKKLLQEVQKIIMHHTPVHKVPYTSEHNEFSKLLTDTQSVSLSMHMYVQYLSYVFRVLKPEDKAEYSHSAMKCLSSVYELRNPTLPNNEFLELTIGCTQNMTVPSSLTKNEFLLSLLIVRYFLIVSPDIQEENFLALCSSLFLFDSRGLLELLHSRVSFSQ
ncbi:hypothetical protein NECID01_1188 [Nematocida sp. AWRm77]|nr:hypothetical protein NECID01_1188 [Nematocida sp. AWRm77]